MSVGGVSEEGEGVGEAKALSLLDYLPLPLYPMSLSTLWLLHRRDQLPLWENSLSIQPCTESKTITVESLCLL